MAVASAEELVRLDIPASAPFVGVARTVMAAVASTVPDIDEERLEDLRIAVSEACTNAIEAHQSTSTDDHVTVRFLLAEDRVEIHIEDRGPGFDSTAVVAPDHVDDIDNLTVERGWGIQLIRALVDEAVFRGAGAGTVVHLVVKRGGG